MIILYYGDNTGRYSGRYNGRYGHHLAHTTYIGPGVNDLVATPPKASLLRRRHSRDTSHPPPCLEPPHPPISSASTARQDCMKGPNLMQLVCDMVVAEYACFLSSLYKAVCTYFKLQSKPLLAVPFQGENPCKRLIFAATDPNRLEGG
jgi:hypothetical protein